MDKNGRNERTSTHFIFDEAHMSSTTLPQPPMAIALQIAGYRQHIHDKPPPLQIKFKHLSSDATTPLQSTTGSAGYDIYSSQNIFIKPQTQTLISTDIAVQIPDNHYGQLKSRSSLVTQHNIHVMAGVIDSDYRGHVQVSLLNLGTQEFKITKGQRIAQLIVVPTPALQSVTTNTLERITRGDKGFGSTGTHSLINAEEIPPSTTAAAAKIHQPVDQSIPPQYRHHEPSESPIYNIELSSSPFHNLENIRIPISGKHNTQGLILTQCDSYDNRVNITGIHPGTSPRRIKNWIQRIKNSTLIAINHTEIKSVNQANDILHSIVHAHSNKTCSPKSTPTFTITVAAREKKSMHHDEGIPMLYFDQLATIAKHLDSIKYDITISENKNIQNANTTINETKSYFIKMLDAMAKHGTLKAAKAILPKNRRSSTKLTRRKLKMLDTWHEWKQSEMKQLNQYHDQNMFGSPCPLPIGANVLDLI